MKLIHDMRDPKLLKGLARKLSSADLKRPMTFMEVCGSHTMAIHRAGIKSLLPEKMGLVSGPGCPVCVTPMDYLDTAMAMAKEHRVTLATFGDMMRIPGSEGSLTGLREQGYPVEVVYSPLNALDLAKNHGDQSIVFLAVGFETTAPTIAATVRLAQSQGVENFSVLCAHKIMPPALSVLVNAPDLKIDGFLLPGHVSLVLGTEPYEFLAREAKRACVIAGFEAADLMLASLMLIEQINLEEPRVKIQYKRTVKAQGNPKARQAMDETFEKTDASWRGFGRIPKSGLKLKEKFASFDSERRFPVKIKACKEPAGCQCGAVVQGRIQPPECPLFQKVCTPQNPVGACMVSSEGSCAAFYKYSRK